MSGDHLDLDAVEARANAATSGPWFHRAQGDVARDATDMTIARCGVTHGALEDADFIAHARVDVPALVAEVRRLREDREMGRTNLAHYSEIIDAQAGENAALRARFRLCSGCDATRARCNEYVEAGAVKCCPDCRHAAGP